jgi:transcriptional regulator with XRE-family HTH domain
MTPEQCREARRLLGWSQDRLAGMSGVTTRVVAAFEAEGRMAKPIDRSPIDRIAAIRSELEQAGVAFVDGEAPGVRLKKVAP